MADTITVSISRYRPEQESEPTWEDYDVPLTDNWVILDALNYIKDAVDGSLSYRWSCRMGRMRQLRDDGERRAHTYLRRILSQVRARPDSDRASAVLPRGA